MGQAKETETVSSHSPRKKRFLIALFVAVALSLVAYSLFDSLSQTDRDTPSDQRSESRPGGPWNPPPPLPRLLLAPMPRRTLFQRRQPRLIHPPPRLLRPTTTTTAAPEVTTTETRVPSTDGTETTRLRARRMMGPKRRKNRAPDTGEDVEKGGLGYGLGDEVRYSDPDPAGKNVDVGLDGDSSEEKGDGGQGGGKGSNR